MTDPFQPYTLAGVPLRDRFVRSATVSPYAAEGVVGRTGIERYRTLARERVGLIITEMVYISPDGQASRTQAGLWDESCIAHHKEIVEAVHEEGGKVFVQLNHGGAASLCEDPLSPSGVPSLYTGMPARAMTEDDMARVARDFAAAAARAEAAGYDGIQIHCAHGYLLSQFLDPTTNLRTDDYGGSAANRFRFPGECLTAIRQAVGQDYPVLVKVNTNCAGEADEAYAQDILYFCRQFEALGADAIELSGYNWLGLGKKKVPTFYLDRAKAIRQAVKIPLILVGGVRGPESAQAILDAGIDFVSASRPFICQPDFVQHLEKGEDSPCIGCTKCLGNIWAKEGRRCVKHPIPPEFATQA